jgi:hypothetical protein
MKRHLNTWNQNYKAKGVIEFTADEEGVHVAYFVDNEEAKGWE